jgi:hypothetical protein
LCCRATVRHTKIQNSFTYSLFRLFLCHCVCVCGYMWICISMYAYIHMHRHMYSLRPTMTGFCHVRLITQFA